MELKYTGSPKVFQEDLAERSKKEYMKYFKYLSDMEKPRGRLNCYKALCKESDGICARGCIHSLTNVPEDESETWLELVKKFLEEYLGVKFILTEWTEETEAKLPMEIQFLLRMYERNDLFFA